MNTPSTLFEIAAIDKDHLPKLRSEFKSNTGHCIAIEYNSSQQCFRLHAEDMHRLFFYNSNRFHKTVFKNEYGAAVGSLSHLELHSGKVQIDAFQYHYQLEGEDPKVSLYNSNTSAPILSFEINDELIIDNLTNKDRNNLLHCLVFGFGWLLKQAPAPVYLTA